MAVEVESQGQVQEFLDILRRRRWQVALPAMFVFVLGCAFAAIMPRLYVVSTRIEIKPVVLDEEQLSRNTQDNPTAIAVGAADHQIKHFRRIKDLIEELGWQDYGELTAFDKTEYISRVQNNLFVNVLEKTTKGGSDFVDITYKDIQGDRAERFLNRLAQVWVLEVIERDRQVLEAEQSVYQNRYIEAQNLKETRLRELTTLTAQFEIELNDLYRSGSVYRLEDPVQTRLHDLESAIEELEIEIAQDEANLAALQGSYDEEEPFVPIPVQEQGLSFAAERAAVDIQIQTLKLQQSALKPANSKWQAIQELIDEQMERLDILGAMEVEGALGNEFQVNPLREQLRGRIDDLDIAVQTKAGRLQEQHAKLQTTRAAFQERADAVRLASELRDDIDNLNEQYIAAHTAFLHRGTKLDVLDLAHGAPYEMVEEAIAPDAPSEPNPLLIVAFALIAGLALGLGSALLTEYSTSCYRSVADVTRIMAVPVLGVVGTIMTRAELRRKRFQRFVIGLSSVLIIGSIAWFTFAYMSHQDWLGTGVVQRIEDLRLKMR